MDPSDIVIANLGHEGLLVARYQGNWRDHGALVMTWTVTLNDVEVAVFDGESRCESKAPLDGLEAHGWVKPSVNRVSDTCVEVQFDVATAAMTTHFLWRLDTRERRLDQWLT